MTAVFVLKILFLLFIARAKLLTKAQNNNNKTTADFLIDSQDESLNLSDALNKLNNNQQKQENNDEKNLDFENSADLCYLASGASSLTLTINEATAVGSVVGSVDVSIRFVSCFISLVRFGYVLCGKERKYKLCER